MHFFFDGSDDSFDSIACFCIDILIESQYCTNMLSTLLQVLALALLSNHSSLLAPVEALSINRWRKAGGFSASSSSTDVSKGNDASQLPESSRRSELFRAAFGVVASAILSPFSAQAIADGSNSDIRPGGEIQYGKDKELMSQKGHGTTATRVQQNLRFGVSDQLADKICSFNRHFAEHSGYFLEESNFKEAVLNAKQPLVFYDSVTGKPLFVAPIGRTADEFLRESEVHGWPSFRDQEVVWDNVRVLSGIGETVSVDGTHLGHNLPDRKGNRYCINVVSIAGNPLV